MKPIILENQEAFLKGMHNNGYSKDVIELITAAILVRNADANQLIKVDDRYQDQHGHGRESLERLARAVDGLC